MKKMRDLLKQRLAEKKMGSLSRAALVISTLRKHADHPEEFTGHVKRHIAYIHIDPQEDKTKRFLQKKQLLEEVHKALNQAGYDHKIQDIRITT